MYESMCDATAIAQCDATAIAQSPAFAENPSCSAQPEGGSAGRTCLMAMALMVRKWGETTVYLHHLLIMAATGNSEAYVKHVNWRSSGRRRLLHSTLCRCEKKVQQHCSK